MPAHQYPAVQLFIGGEWRPARAGRTLEVTNPATGETIGSVAHADIADLDDAIAAAARGFQTWRRTGSFERYTVLRRAAALLRERSTSIAPLLTLEQGKTLAEASGEVAGAADVVDWFAEESRRTNGWIIPSRAVGVRQLALKEPIGPVAAFTPWNFPISQIVRKMSAALGAGCSIIVKAPEETPASPAELIRAFADAGVPAGAIALVFGDPAQISEHLIPHPVIRKVTFTGSTAVGKKLAALAGAHMKPVTMELGGHAPAIVFDDADLESASEWLARSKFRNAGQVCISPTRFLIQDKAYDEFVERFQALAEAQVVGDGLDPLSTMGPMANPRRISAMETLVEDAVSKGAQIRTGGARVGNRGEFFAPTLLTGMTTEMRAFNEEPFGPIALMSRFTDIAEVMAEANRLPYGLAAYGFTRSGDREQALIDGVEAGMITINHVGLGLPEVPFGGIKDSGHGSEGGPEAIQAYLTTKFASVRSSGI